MSERTLSEESRLEERRVRWLCRRGMKELDVLLARFVDAQYRTLSAEEHDALIALLEKEDPDLWYLVMGRMVADNDLQESMLERIRVFETVQR